MDIDDTIIQDLLNDYDNPQTIVKYGQKEIVRLNSPFYCFLLVFIEKIEHVEQSISHNINPFWSVDLLKMIIKLYLSFPLMSASLLPVLSEDLGIIHKYNSVGNIKGRF